MAKATILERGTGAAVGQIDIRHGECVAKQADESLHRLAGELLCDWWIYGVKWPHGSRPNFWVLGIQTRTGASVEFDLRVALLNLARKQGLRSIPRYCSVDHEGRSILEAGARLDVVKLGRDLHQWYDYRGKDRRVDVVVRMPDGQDQRFKIDPRAALNQIMRAFQRKFDQEREKARECSIQAATPSEPGAQAA